MAHNYEYKILTQYFPDDLSALLEPNKSVELEDLLDKAIDDFGENIPKFIRNLDDHYQWEVVSQSIAFLNNHPVGTILLRRKRN